MNCYLNNFSLTQANNGNSISQILSDFFSVCEKIRTYSFERIFMPPNYSDIPLSNGISINEFILTNTSVDVRKPVDDFISKIKNIRKNQLSLIRHDNPDEKIMYVYYSGVESIFFKKANNQEVPLISFRTMNIFDSTQLNINIEILDSNEEILHSSSSVKNISRLAHIDFHIDFLQQKAREQFISDQKWNAEKVPFRLTEKMVQYLIDENFENRRNADENYRMKLFLEIGTTLAEMNGWIHHVEYSNRFSSAERKRRIFYSTGKRRMYLSIDVRHGEFELHKHTGKHIMSYDFDGQANGKTYTDTSHDLLF